MTEALQVLHVVPHKVSEPERLVKAVRSVGELFQTRTTTMVVFGAEAQAHSGLLPGEVCAMKAADMWVGDGHNIVAGIQEALQIASQRLEQITIIAVHADPKPGTNLRALDGRLANAASNVRFVIFEQLPDAALIPSTNKVAVVPANADLSDEFALTQFVVGLV